MRILFVGGAYSVHTSRWIRQLRHTGWDVHLFDPLNGLVHEELEGITLHTGWKKPRVPQGTRTRCRWPFLRGRHLMARRFPALWRRILPAAEQRLARLVEKIEPDCIHALGLRDYASVVLRAKQLLGGELGAPWIFSCRGSDIYFFRRTEQERRMIEEVLAECDYLVANCRRDVRLARDFGFAGQVLGLYQGGGGYPISEMVEGCPPGAPSERRAVAVKGLETVLGNAVLTIEALRLCVDRLEGYRLLFYQAHSETVAAARAFAEDTGIEIEILPRVHYRRIWALFGRSRVSIGVSLSDGIPNAMLESMIMGAFPVQTDPGGATSEWIEDGVNGLLVPPDDVNAIAAAVTRALEDDVMVDGAVEINRRLARERIDEETVRAEVIEHYRKVAGGRDGES